MLVDAFGDALRCDLDGPFGEAFGVEAEVAGDGDRVLAFDALDLGDGDPAARGLPVADGIGGEGEEVVGQGRDFDGRGELAVGDDPGRDRGAVEQQVALERGAARSASCSPGTSTRCSSARLALPISVSVTSVSVQAALSATSESRPIRVQSAMRRLPSRFCQVTSFLPPR